MNFIKSILKLFICIVVITILTFALRGISSSPDEKEVSTNKWTVNGPFELSPERGRFGLTYSIIENKSFYFTLDLARFIIPDLGYKDGHYVSLFAPGVSFLVIPGYLVGKYFGASQLGTYFTVLLFAFFNFMLIKQLVKKITGSGLSGWISGLIFLFSTPSFAYAVSLYQHHISLFLILSALYLLMLETNVVATTAIWFLCAMSIPVDYPNLFLMLPIGLYAFLKMFIVKNDNINIRIFYRWVMSISIVGLILPILFFGWFNFKSYGNALQFSGTVGSVGEIGEDGLPTSRKTVNLENVSKFVDPDQQDKSAIDFFKSRNLINGLYLHILSPDRGIIYFTPIILFGVFGVFILYKNRNVYLPVMLGILFANLILYSMWGDPWGGWAFGSRYLIPLYAIMSIFIGVALAKFRKKWLFLIILYLLFTYSVMVNTLGAITTSANPPKVEALALEAISGKQERYSYDRNWEFLKSGKSKSFVFQTWGKEYVDSVHYYYIVSGAILLLTTTLIISLYLKKDKNNE